MSGSWSSGWVTNDIVTAAEFRKGLGAVAHSELGSAAASIDFSGLPTSYAHMRIVIGPARGDTAATSMLASVRFNNDSAANYHVQRILGNAATASAAESLTQTSFPVGDLPANTAPSGLGGSIEILIPGYSSATLAKGVIATNACPLGSSTTNLFVETRGGFWNSTVAINRVTLIASAGNFAIGTRATVYVMGS